MDKEEMEQVALNKARAEIALRKIQRAGWATDVLRAVTQHENDDLVVVMLTRQQAAEIVAFLAMAGGNLLNTGDTRAFTAPGASAMELALSVGEQAFGPVEEPDQKEEL